MVNTMDLGRGFLKLQEDNNSRRSSSLFRHKPLELNENGLHYVTRINCGCGQCVPFRVKVEKDDGGLRIGKLTLATNCHLIIVIFGFFFLIAGSVLTALAYKEPTPDPDLPVNARAVPVGIFLFGGGGDQTVASSPKSPTIQVTDPSGFQEIELGSPTTESAPPSASLFSSSRGNANLGDSTTAQQQQYYYNHYSRKTRSQSDGTSMENVSARSNGTSLGNGGGGGGNGDYRRGSSRDGGVGSGGGGGNNRNLNPNDDQNKVNLALRPSLPIIPMFATSQHYFSRVVTPLDARSLYVSSRSDEPFGSIASLSTSGDIACFPVTSSSSSMSAASNATANNGGGGGTSVMNMQPTPECDKELSTATSSSSSVITEPRILNDGGIGSANNNANDISNNKKNANISSSNMDRKRMNNGNNADDYNVANNSSISSSNPIRKGISELPPINVNDYGSKMSSNSGGGNGGAGHVTGAPVGFRPKSILRQSKSEDWQEGGGGSGDGGDAAGGGGGDRGGKQ